MLSLHAADAAAAAAAASPGADSSDTTGPSPSAFGARPCDSAASSSPQAAVLVADSKGPSWGPGVLWKPTEAKLAFAQERPKPADPPASATAASAKAAAPPPPTAFSREGHVGSSPATASALGCPATSSPSFSLPFAFPNFSSSLLEKVTAAAAAATISASSSAIMAAVSAAHAVASGWSGSNAKPKIKSKATRRGISEAAPEASSEELGEPWGRGGARWVWAHDGTRPNGWIVFCQGGLLQTKWMEGSWQPLEQDPACILVTFNDVEHLLRLDASLRFRLILKRRLENGMSIIKDIQDLGLQPTLRRFSTAIPTVGWASETAGKR
mmetsp:Transcript_61780/g.135119  ORF Transcript_61780/g.135119 Transcript_61780/m.135119 type:complete len:326 (-) Transcript_61780:196-1173(-)